MRSARDRAAGAAARRQLGFTLVEVIIVMAITTTILSIAIPKYMYTIEKAEGAVAVKDIRDIQTAIDLYEQANGVLPDSLADIGFGDLLDPWGNPYQYTNFSKVKGKGKLRKDKFLVPINSTYDLYSMGPDGASVSPLTAAPSRDDIIRANDGGYLGEAALY